MTPALREQVRRRANDCCEYCLMPQHGTCLPHEVDHIRAQKHAGLSILENLAWACALCNGYKQSDIAGILPGTEQIVRLFHPRLDHWPDHFGWKEATLFGNTEIGQVTIYVLGINRPERLEHRHLLMRMKLFYTIE